MSGKIRGQKGDRISGLKLFIQALNDPTEQSLCTKCFSKFWDCPWKSRACTRGWVKILANWLDGLKLWANGNENEADRAD